MLCYLAFYSDIITSCQFISSGSNGIQIGFLNLHERGSAVVTQSTYLRTGISIIIAVTPLKKVKLFLTKCNRKKMKEVIDKSGLQATTGNFPYDDDI